MSIDDKIVEAIDDAKKGNDEKLTKLFLGNFDLSFYVNHNKDLINKLEPLVDEGNNHAKAILGAGLLYKDIYNTPTKENELRGISLLEEAGNEGHLYACCALGYYYKVKCREETIKALEWFKKAKDCDGPVGPVSSIFNHSYINNSIEEIKDRMSKSLEPEKLEKKSKVKSKVKKVVKEKVEKNITEPTKSTCGKVKDIALAVNRKFVNQVKSDVKFVIGFIFKKMMKIFLMFIWNKLATRKTLAFLYVSVILVYVLHHFGYVYF